MDQAESGYAFESTRFVLQACIWAGSLAVVKFSDALKSARKKADLTQDQLAEKSGISRPFIGLLEQDRRSVPALYLERLATALKLEGKDRADFLEAGHLTHVTESLDVMLRESRAQVRFLADLCGLGSPVTPSVEEVKKYGAEGATRLATLRRANQRLYDQVLELGGKRIPPHLTGVDEVPDAPAERPAAPFAPKLRKQAKKK